MIQAPTFPRLLPLPDPTETTENYLRQFGAAWDDPEAPDPEDKEDADVA